MAGCLKLASRQGMCSTHRTRARRGRPLDAPVRRYASSGGNRWRRLADAAVEYTEARELGGTVFKRAAWRLRDAVKQYSRNETEREAA